MTPPNAEIVVNNLIGRDRYVISRYPGSASPLPIRTRADVYAPMTLKLTSHTDQYLNELSSFPHFLEHVAEILFLKIQSQGLAYKSW